MKISENLSLKEVIKSNTADRLNINNMPTDEHLENLKIVAEKIFQPIREHFGVAIGVSSGYRSEGLNRAVKGSKTSHHCKGMALDLDADIFRKVTNKEIFDFILQNLDFTQLIWEYGTNENPNWVHVAYDKNNLKKQVLKAVKGKGYVNML
ncbi:MAG: peptidase M15 [Candidatus Aenigmarchaeota archaeon]|nr:peptidase M15 [Candidatus Aenigmarchaeota archaeon]